MSDFERLLEATIEHLHHLKSNGVRHVPVDRESLAHLRNPPPAPSRPAVPKKEPQSQLRASAPLTVPERIAALPPVEPSAPVVSWPSGPSSLNEKENALAQLQNRAMNCIKCPHLASSRNNVVFGIGNADSPVMFVGEGPGAEEDAAGEPFVGRAGQLLTRIIETMGLTRKSVYIANVLKCRPDTPGQTSGNRKPTPEEMKTCLPYLLAQIEIIQPRIIVALGATAMEGLFGTDCAITKERGKWRPFRQARVMPTYHPSYVLRVGSTAVKRQVWEDMLTVMEALEMPISEKQRNHFKSA